MSTDKYKRQILATDNIIETLHYSVFAINCNNIYQPNYVCKTDQVAIVYSTSTAAINETHKKLFNIQIQYSGWLVIGFDDKKIAKKLQVGVQYFSFKISIHNITVFIFALDSSTLEELNFAGPSYQSSFSHKFCEKQSLIVQSILKDKCQIDIYQQAEKIQTYSDVSPKDVWSKLKILNNIDGKELFGINNWHVIMAILYSYWVRSIQYEDL
ncbi:hypothetical protein C1646_772939 [Rhizophagus diaphanus]|nr:hypothetical protein C1646_772939 [Rhizophagus diaphanus] [Rhizophagus sp. MUCL 43196]